MSMSEKLHISNSKKSAKFDNDPCVEINIQTCISAQRMKGTEVFK